MSSVRLQAKRKATLRHYRANLIATVEQYLDLSTELKVETFTHPLLKIAFYAGERYLNLCTKVIELLNDARSAAFDNLVQFPKDDIVEQLNKYCYVTVNDKSVDYIENYVKTSFASMTVDSRAPVQQIDDIYHQILDAIQQHRITIDLSLRLINTYKAGYRNVRANTN